MISLAEPDLDDAELNAVKDVLQSGWLSQGQKVGQFEKDFAELIGAKHGIACSSGTSALHLSLKAIGVGPGDRVVMPSLTFVAGANCTALLGAEPVFVDVESLHTPTVNPKEIERAISKYSPKAVIAMHYGGWAAEMSQISDVCSRSDVTLVEDACHAPGVSYQGRPLGTFGAVGCFSFFSNKNIVTGEGGCIVTNDTNLAEKLRHLRSHGIAKNTWSREGHLHQYDVEQCGFNYRLDEIRAAMGSVQLKKLAANQLKRMELVKTYKERLDSHLEIPFKNNDESAFHLFVVLLPKGIKRSRIQQLLTENDIQHSAHYPPSHLLTAHRDFESLDLSITEEFSERCLTLPLHPRLSLSDVEKVCDVLLAGIQH